MKKRFLLQLMLLVLPLMAWAQDVCYLIGKDAQTGKPAGEPFATLVMSENRVYKGNVTFPEQFAWGTPFVISTRLYDPEDEDQTKFEKACFSHADQEQTNVMPGEAMTLAQWSDGVSDTYIWVSEPDIEFDKSYPIVVDLNKMSLLVGEEKVTDPDNDQDDTTPPSDIDLTQGVHLTVTVNEAGSLKQRVNSAAINADVDLVDFLTIKGKMGGADFAYLQAQEGWVSQLQYLDISEVELVYDDEPYFQNGTGGFYSQHTNIFTLSAENKDEQGAGGQQGQVTVTSTICRRNDLSHAFEKMAHLKECYLPKTLPAIGEGMFSGTLIFKVGMPTAPAYIGDNAFYNENGWYGGEAFLTAIDLPASVKHIGASAFSNQPLQTINIEHVTSFGANCFYGTNLSSVTLNDRLELIPEGMFSGCKNLQSVSLPAEVVEIGGAAFSECIALNTLTMGDKVKKIGAGTFSGCKALENMTISPNIEEVGRNAFACAWAEKQPIEGGVLYIGKVAYERDRKTPGANTAINIKEGTVSLADYFANNHAALTSITLPSTLRILGARCLAGTSLSSITLPESLEKIGIEAFAAGDGGSGSLRRITIPKNVTSIGNRAFAETPLVRVTYNAENASLYNLYGVAVERIFPESVTRVIIGEGVKSIPNNLFDGCRNITRVEMASTVERIGDYAFAGCTSLSHIDLPSSMKYLGKYSLACGNLESVASYIKEPQALWVPDFSDITPDTEGGYSHMEGPFGYTGYSFSAADGTITSWEVYADNQVPLLEVPNGALDTYMNEKTWAAQFQTIQQFDGASSAEAIEESTTVSVSQSVTEETDLSGTMMGSIFVTLDTEDSGDGYNASEGCLVINSTVSDEQLEAATADDADDLTVKNQFNGLIFEVPAGKGNIAIDCQTLGQNVICVKIGSSEPQQVEAATKQQITIPYRVSESTRIYVYAAKSDGSVNAAPSRATDDRLRRAAYANDDAVKLYSLAINVDGNLTGIDDVKSADPVQPSVHKIVENSRIVIVTPQGRKYSTNGSEIE